MEFEYSPRCKDLQVRLLKFMDDHIYPNEHAHHAEIEANRAKGNPWVPLKLIEDLKVKARAAGLWNMFLPRSERAPGGGLSNLDYAPLCEIMGRSPWSAEVFNCSAPDTGNMETFERYGTEEQKRMWLDPLLRGEIRSAYVMTEPQVASSDATNLETTILPDGDDYVINGRKWWISGIMDTRWIAVGTPITGRPPHRSQHAQFTH